MSGSYHITFVLYYLRARFALGSNEGGISATTVFDDAALSGIINVDQAESLAVALGPLEVVQEGPDDVALDGHALAYDLGDGLDVRAQVVYTLLVVNVVVAVPVIVEGSFIRSKVNLTSWLVKAWPSFHFTSGRNWNVNCVRSLEYV